MFICFTIFDDQKQFNKAAESNFWQSFILENYWMVFYMIDALVNDDCLRLSSAYVSLMTGQVILECILYCKSCIYTHPVNAKLTRYISWNSTGWARGNLSGGPRTWLGSFLRGFV